MKEEEEWEGKLTSLYKRDMSFALFVSARQKKEVTDGPTDGWTDGRTYQRTHPHIELWLTTKNCHVLATPWRCMSNLTFHTLCMIDRRYINTEKTKVWKVKNCHILSLIKDAPIYKNTFTQTGIDVTLGAPSIASRDRR